MEVEKARTPVYQNPKIDLRIDSCSTSTRGGWSLTNVEQRHMPDAKKRKETGTL